MGQKVKRKNSFVFVDLTNKLENKYILKTGTNEVKGIWPYW